MDIPVDYENLEHFQRLLNSDKCGILANVILSGYAISRPVFKVRLEDYARTSKITLAQARSNVKREINQFIESESSYYLG